MNSPRLDVDKVLQGDCVEVLNQLPEKSVDLVFADPPYNLQLQQSLLRPNQTEVDAVNDAWDQFDDYAAYDQFTRNWLSACRRVLKDTGTLWVIGSYHNIYRVGSILQDLGYWFLNDIVWIKCLSGNTELYARVNGSALVSSLKDLVQINLEKNVVELPSYDEGGCATWVRLTHWRKTEATEGLIINLEDGTWVECTPEHRFPVVDHGRIVMKAAKDISRSDTLLKLGHFELPVEVQSAVFDEVLGEFVGRFLAEGAYRADDNGVQLTLPRDEEPVALNLIDLIRQRFGVVGRVYKYQSICRLVFPGRFMVEFVRRFVSGRDAQHKRLARECFAHGTDFLHGILRGYLAGDGHFEAETGRWKFGFARNEGLLTDLSVIARILGWRLKFRYAHSRYQSGVSETILGELCENTDSRRDYPRLDLLGMSSRRNFGIPQAHSTKRLRDYKVVNRTRRTHRDEMSSLGRMAIHGDIRFVSVASVLPSQKEQFYDLSVTGNHIFALANGLLTHNSNPMPNFRGVRFTNAHETLLWVKKSKDQKKYTFNYHAMKSLNEGLQMRSDWEIPICTGAERLVDEDGRKIHSTQKPEALLYRVILSSTNPGDVVLDPFFGTGTTGAVAKKLGRHYIGIEREEKYIQAAVTRLEAIPQPLFADAEIYGQFDTKRGAPRIPFSSLLENGMLSPGQQLYFRGNRSQAATILADGSLKLASGDKGSIHQVGALIGNLPACNGWDHWYFEDEHRELKAIDYLREQIRKQMKSGNGTI